MIVPVGKSLIFIPHSSGGMAGKSALSGFDIAPIEDWTQSLRKVGSGQDENER